MSDYKEWLKNNLNLSGLTGKELNERVLNLCLSAYDRGVEDQISQMSYAIEQFGVEEDDPASEYLRNHF